MADAPRARRLADRVRTIVASTLETRVKDPRLGFVTVTDARMSSDLQSATVYYTVYGDEAQRTATAAALESAKGVLRSEVGRQTGVRHTPSLAFVADAVPENAQHIEELLRTAASRDAEVHRVAAGAAYAGEPDPYRAPRDGDLDDVEGGDDADIADDSADDSADDLADDSADDIADDTGTPKPGAGRPSAALPPA